MKTRPLFFASFAAVLACAAPTAVSTSAAASPRAAVKQAQGASPALEKGDLEKLFGREQGPLEPLPFVSLNGRTKGTVEATRAPSVHAEGDKDIIEIPIGTVSPIFCVLAHGRMDAATTVAAIIRQLKTKFEMQPIKAVEIAMAGESPAMFSDYAYFVPADGGKKNMGQVKTAVVVHPRHSLLCQHDEPGYTATFRRVVLGLATSLLTDEGSPLRTEAEVAQVAIIKDAKMSFGFRELLVWRTAGGTRSVSVASMLVPVGPDLLATDEVQSTTDDAAGIVDTEILFRAVNGETNAHITLERQAGGNEYKLSGTKRGAPVAAVLRTKAGLTSEAREASLIRDNLIGDKVGEVQFEEYIDAFDSKGTSLTVLRKEDAKSPRIVGSSEGVKYVLIPDAAGWPLRIERADGLVFERVWTRSSP